ncbi:MAG TPA: hypothetical protein V6D07_13685 [Trichocoleus sp.]
MEIESRKSGNWLTQILNWSHWLVRRVGLKLALIGGLGAFMLAVGVDSSSNYAKAADLREGSIQTVNLVVSHPSKAASNQLQSQLKQTDEPTYLEFDPAIANRLSHGDLTRAVLTGNHLTRAHLFTHTANSVE